jgi:hypothetical protein
VLKLSDKERSCWIINTKITPWWDNDAEIIKENEAFLTTIVYRR